MFCLSKPVPPSNVYFSKPVSPRTACPIKLVRPSNICPSKSIRPSNLYPNKHVRIPLKLFVKINLFIQVMFVQIKPFIQ